MPPGKLKGKIHPGEMYFSIFYIALSKFFAKDLTKIMLHGTGNPIKIVLPLLLPPHNHHSVTCHSHCFTSTLPLLH